MTTYTCPDCLGISSVNLVLVMPAVEVEPTQVVEVSDFQEADCFNCDWKGEASELITSEGQL